MDLPVNPPLSPMLAKSVKRIPATDSAAGGYLYEPKWDGFRCIVFRDGSEVELGSRNERPLTRYFPEIADAVLELMPERCVVDGEVILPVGERLEFERLLERIHPAESRVRMLAEQTPARFVAFDLLALGDESFVDRPLAERRSALEAALHDVSAPVHLSAATLDADVASGWFDQFEGAGLDGVVAKPLDSAYQPGARAMLKIKHERTADVVVAGYRLHKSSTEQEPRLGSLMLGLHDDRGVLQHVGVSAAFPTARRAELVSELKPLEIDITEHPWGRGASATDGERRPGGETRWNAGKDMSWIALDPVTVCEVGYDHMEGSRFRHTTQFKRWRPDRTPESCTYAQLDEPVSYDLDEVLGTK